MSKIDLKSVKNDRDTLTPAAFAKKYHGLKLEEIKGMNDEQLKKVIGGQSTGPIRPW